MAGCINPFTQEPQLLTNVTSLVFLSKSGNILETHPLKKLRDLEQYYVDTVLPNEGLNIIIKYRLDGIVNIEHCSRGQTPNLRIKDGIKYN